MSREKIAEILELYNQGKTYKEIAKELRVSIKTVNKVINGTFPLPLKRRLEELEKTVHEYIYKESEDLWDAVEHAIKLESIFCPYCGSKKDFLIPVRCLNCGRNFYIDEKGKILKE